MDQSKYARRGVSAGKEEIHEAIKNLDKGLYPNAFCKILPDLAGSDPDYCNIMHADTAGTKTALAYIYWRETGDTDVWKGIAQDAIVMNTDDMACAGAIDDIVLSNTIGRNKKLIPGEVVKAIIDGTQEFIQKMNDLNCTIISAGGETADVGDIVRTADVGFTAFARYPRKKVKDIQIQPGDVVVSIASYGQASYEDEYNSGIGSNGLTFARHEVLNRLYAEKYPESFEPGLDEDVVYTGMHQVTDLHEESGYSIGKLLLSPTRAFLPLIRDILQNAHDKVNGIIHCTGGGQTKVLHFIDGLRIVKNNLLEVPPVFSMIQAQSAADWKEMFQVFNMGTRLEVYTDQETAKAIIDMSKGYNINAQISGFVEKSETKEVLIEGDFGSFEY